MGARGNGKRGGGCEGRKAGDAGSPATSTPLKWSSCLGRGAFKWEGSGKAGRGEGGGGEERRGRAREQARGRGRNEGQGSDR